MNATTCASCGRVVPPGRFCAACGLPLQPSYEAQLQLQGQANPNGTIATAPLERTQQTPAEGVTMRPAPGWSNGSTDNEPEPRADNAVLVPTQATATNELTGRGFGSRMGWRGNRSTGIAAIAVALLAVAAYGIFGLGTEKHTVTGDLALTTANDLSVGDSCHGVGGYSDIDQGTQVIIEDDTGRTLATSAFGPGVFDGTSCVFEFTFTDVPKAPFYRVHQSGNRGVLQYSYADMVNDNWAVHLTLGDD